MLPAAVVNGELAVLVPLLDRGDVIVATRSWEMVEGLWSDRLQRIATAFEGNGYEVDLIEGDDPGQMHPELAATLVKEVQ